jgi:hypothetical protein
MPPNQSQSGRDDYDKMDTDALRGKIGELTGVIANLGEQVKVLADKLEHLKDNRVYEIDKVQVLHGEKISKLEKLVYGVFAAVGMQVLVTVCAAVVWVMRGGKAIP